MLVCSFFVFVRVELPNYQNEMRMDHGVSGKRLFLLVINMQEMKLTNAPESSHRLSWNAVLNFKLHSYAKTRIDFIVESFADTLELSLDSRLPRLIKIAVNMHSVRHVFSRRKR